MIDARFYNVSSDGMTLSELCARLDLTAPDGSLSEARVTYPASLSTSLPGSIAFLESKRSIDQLSTAKATACFVPEKLASAVSEKHIIPLITDFPKFQLSRATDLLVNSAEKASDIASDAQVHPTAIIGPGVSIGERTVIGPYTVISHSRIGADCRIGSNSVIGGEGFGVAIGPAGKMMSVPHIGRVIIENDVRIGSSVCIDRGQLGDTVIGKGTKIDNLVQIAHNCELGKNCVLAGRVGLSGSCKLGDGVMMGGNAGLADHITVGDGARLAAFAGVMNDIPAGETWSGIPAMPLRDHMKIVAQNRRSLKKK